MTKIERLLVDNRMNFHPVVDFKPGIELLHPFNFTAYSTELTEADIADTEKFTRYVDNKLADSGAKYGIGGYDENRVLYRRSNLFDIGAGNNQEFLNDSAGRSVHLGIDIWGAAGTVVFAPMEGQVHSFAFNNHFGDYGATLIVQHQLADTLFHTLYGHISLQDIALVKKGQYINKGETIAHFGIPEENGWWPPHLHFQVIKEMEGKEGDYPGVCTPAERDHFLHNCPDPDLVLNLLQYVQ